MQEVGGREQCIQTTCNQFLIRTNYNKEIGGMNMYTALLAAEETPIADIRKIPGLESIDDSYRSSH